MKHSEFLNPSIEFAPRPLWFWNDKPTKKLLSEIMAKSKEISNYGGFGILPYDDCKLEYMSDEYLDYYGHVLEEAKKLNLKMCLYDEWWFPSGSAGGLLKKIYPEACAKRLDKIEYEVNGEIDIKLPKEKIMSVVSMNTTTNEIINLSQFVNSDRLCWQTNETNWKVMIFVCVQDGWDRVNYLDPNSVKKFIEITHEAYYKNFKEYFANVIDSSFYDEPQFYTTCGRIWIDDFNEKFKAKYGFDADTLYPALWYDIGKDTAYARNMLLGFRAELYSLGYPKIIQDWCTEHNIKLTGHVDQEEVINPVGITGDLMKSFKYQDIPGFDQIFHAGRAGKIIKIVSSSAYNWDKPLVMSESFGAFPDDLSILDMYNDVMDQFSKGMNLLVPHAIWLNDDSDKIVFKPELSYRNSKFNAELSEFNKYCSRISYVLQGGRHVADIAVLYPIHGLTSAYSFDWGGKPHLGGPVKDEFDYQDIGQILFTELRKDFTFIHPEILDERCFVENKTILLNNKNNFERYKIVILTGSDTISLSNARKLKQFYDNGGIIISTGMIPVKSVEQGKDAEIINIMNDIFINGSKRHNGYYSKDNKTNGQSYHMINKSAIVLNEILDICRVEFDINIDILNHSNNCVTYIHKIKDCKDIYYITNQYNQATDLNITISSTKKFEIWNPHDGSISAINSTVKDRKTKLICSIPANSSIILVSD